MLMVTESVLVLKKVDWASVLVSWLKAEQGIKHIPVYDQFLFNLMNSTCATVLILY